MAEGAPGRSASGRADRRRTDLVRLQVAGREGAPDAVARGLRELLWQKRPHERDHVLIRSGLVLRDTRARSPLRAVAAKGLAVQMLLVAIFAAQCRRPERNAGAPTPIPFADADGPGQPSWRLLVAQPSAGRGATNRGRRDHDLVQLRNAAGRLVEHGRIDLAEPQARGRFERFRLLDESVGAGQPALPYRVPAPDGQEPGPIAVPATFFTRGWVHALTPDEIVVYLHLLWLHQQLPDQARAVVAETGLPVTPEQWEQAFDRPRAYLEPYRRLARMRLIDVAHAPDRRQDGTLPAEDDGAYRPFNEMRFFLDPARLDQDGVHSAIAAMNTLSPPDGSPRIGLHDAQR